jgi:hypothetical protein
MTDARYWGPETILYSTNGDPARKVPMVVRDVLSDELAPLYADPARVTPLPNPVKTDQYGNLSFYIDPGAYLVSMSGSSYSFTIVVDPFSSGGGGGGTGPFEFIQSVPQAVWSVTHNLGYRPASVSLFSMDFSQPFDEFAVQHTNANQLLISMDVPTAGRALIA